MHEGLASSPRTERLWLNSIGVCPRAAGVVLGSSLLLLTLAVWNEVARPEELSSGERLATRGNPAGIPRGMALQLASVVDASAARASCTMFLDRLSYDDPGVDDEEWIQLVVVSDGSPSTFADCGVGTLELLNGSGAGCPVYESIALGSLPIPSDGNLVICSPQSTLGAACHGTLENGSVLENGWLQNGPDALRLVSMDGTELWSAGYGGAVPCDVAESLPPDRDVTSANGSTSDGVLVRCGNGFVLVAYQDAMPGQAASCPEPSEQEPDPGAAPSTITPTAPIDSTPSTMPTAVGTPLGTPSGAADVEPTAPEGTMATAAPPLSSATTQAEPASDPRGTIADAGVQVVSRAVVVDAATAMEQTAQGASAADRQPPKLPSVGCQLLRTKGAARFGWLWPSSFVLGLAVHAIRRRLARAALRCFAISVARPIRAFALRCELRPRR